jgi:PAS domain S-box-containing protein
VSNVNQNARKDGSLLWVAWTNRALLDDRGEVAEVLAIGNDVTDLMEAQAARRESEERLTLALAAGGIATWDYQIEEGTVDWNDEHFRMLGYEVAEVEPGFESFHARVHPEDAQAVSDAFFGSLECGGDYQAEFRAVLPDGGIRWIDAYGHLVLTPDGAPRRSYGVMLDVTEQKRAELLVLERGAEQAAQAERGRLARDLHDSVTQSLFAASLKAEALMFSGEAFSPEVVKAIEELRRLSRGALAQMRTMLLELRSEAVEEVPLRLLLRNLAEAAESRASIDVALVVRGEAVLPPEVHGALYRITEEALNNVARHSRARRAWVELDLSADAARLIVGDDGLGFDEAAADPSHMGLKTMRERAEEAGAAFSVTTKAGEGAVVAVHWPAAGRAGSPAGAARSVE